MVDFQRVGSREGAEKSYGQLRQQFLKRQFLLICAFEEPMTDMGEGHPVSCFGSKANSGSPKQAGQSIRI